MSIMDRRDFFRVGLSTLGAIAIAGCTGSGAGDGSDNGDGPDATATPTATPSLSIAEFAFAADEPAGYGQYEEQPDATYSADEVIWIYLAVDGVTGEESGDGEVRIDLHESLSVLAPDGSTALEQQFTFDREFPEDALDQFYVVNDVTLPASAPSGTYTVEVEFVDRLSDASTTASAEFVIE